VPAQRSIARRFRDLPIGEADKLLTSPIHEERLTAHRDAIRIATILVNDSHDVRDRTIAGHQTSVLDGTRRKDRVLIFVFFASVVA
jgi:hypothetical protein